MACRAKIRAKPLISGDDFEGTGATDSSSPA
jgi:hypothetical protein